MTSRVFNCTVAIPDTDGLLRKFNLEKGGLVQEVIDEKVIDYSIPYCPFDMGTLAYSPYIASVIGSGVVVYPGPYARYLYYGVVVTDENGRVFVGKGEKKPIVTNRLLQYKTDLNPLAGSFWVERMKADHLKDIVQEARNAAGIK